MTGASKETDPFEARSPYAASKAGADLLVFLLHHLRHPGDDHPRGQQHRAARYPGERGAAFLHQRHRRSTPCRCTGTGERVRQYEYVMDHVEGIETVLLKGEFSKSLQLQGREDSETPNIVMATGCWNCWASRPA